MATPQRKRAIQIDDSPLPTVMKRKVLMSQDEEQQDGDIQSDSDSSGSEAVSTSSDSEASTNSDSMDFDVPELRSICDGVTEAEFEEVDTILRQQHPWIKDVDDSSRDVLRIILFQRLVKLCDRLDQKYSLASPKSYDYARDLFDANPQLVSEIDGCWCNPEGSFLPICNLEILQAPHMRAASGHHMHHIPNSHVHSKVVS